MRVVRGILTGAAVGALFWLAVAALLLAGCAGGGGSSSDPPAAPVSIATPPPPAPPEHTCPSGQVGNPCAPAIPPPLPACPTGTTEFYATVCQCPPAYVSGAYCVIPPPAPPPPPQACPVGTTPGPLTCYCAPVYFDVTHNSCVVPAPPALPSVSLTAAPNPIQAGGSTLLTWNSTGALACYGASLSPWALWPGADQLPASGFVTAGPITQTETLAVVCQNGVGNAEVSVVITVSSTAPPPNPPTCTPPAVLIGGTCQPPPTLSAMALAISPVSVADSSQGCPPPDAAQSCVATITGWPPSSTLAGDAFVCLDQDSNALNPAIGWSTAPWPGAADGPHVYTLDCRDGYGASASASITLNVVPPLANPNVDTFTGVLNGGIFTATWQTYSVQGAGGCSVQQANASGLLSTLNPGGTPSGSASSGFLSPSGDPYEFTLICSGAPDAGVPVIVVSP